ncbi:hypothetical protein F5I97DRAFT_1861277 [Phlebopus sp. FC_14]|nr:hypothetical protein F5I97DRAFT_1861277 [Phlebopus sp. FC_14]
MIAVNCTSQLATTCKPPRSAVLPYSMMKPWAAAWKSLTPFLLILLVISTLSLFTSVYVAAVNPLLGSTATEKHLDYVILSTVVFSLIVPARLAPSHILFAVAILVQSSPHTSYWVSASASRYGEPVAASVISHAMVLAPVVYLSVSLAVAIDPRLALMALAANALQMQPFMMLIARQFAIDIQQDHHTVCLILGSLAFLAWTWLSTRRTASCRTPDTRSALGTITFSERLCVMLVPVTVLLFPSIRSPTLASSQVFPYESPGYPLRILSSEFSVTGVVVVGEVLPPPMEANSTALHSIRYLRASHSLLGGVWIGSRVITMDNVPSLTDEDGIPLGDSIYSAFVLQEAARLVDSTPHGERGKWNHALFIGLGAGISANAFQQHGIPTTIVEIDPAVYSAARKYFGLSYPGDGNVFLEDARGWLRKRVAAMQRDESGVIPKYDLIVHDCFSGGGVPQHLFSMEFWDDLRMVMSPGGIVAVNLAGKLASKSSRAIITTLLAAFGQCRTFHDLLEPANIPDYQLYASFLNMVVFCSTSLSPLSFRPSVDTDYLHSYLRHRILSSLDQREISLSHVSDMMGWSEERKETFVLTDTNNRLDQWQQEEALKHWKVMREILPDVVWEMY